MNPYEDVYAENTIKKKKYDGYDMAIEPDEDVDDDEEEEDEQAAKNPHLNIQKYFQELAETGETEEPFAERRTQTIADRERGKYHERRQKLQLSPGVRYDPFAEGSQTPDIHSVRRTTISVMRETQVMKEKQELEYKLKEKAKAGELKPVEVSETKKKRRWDQTSNAENVETPQILSTKDMETPMHQIWEPTPARAESGAVTPPDLSSISETPRVKTTVSSTRRRWDETPKTERGAETPHLSGWAETPKVERLTDEATSQKSVSAKKRSRWDETPVGVQTAPGSATPSYTPSSANMTPVYSGGAIYDMTPSMATPAGIKAMNLQTPVASMIPMTPEQMQTLRYEREIDESNRPISDEELDTMFPAGYKILAPPDGYRPIRTPARKLIATPTPMQNQALGGGFRIMDTPERTGTASQLLPDLQPQGANLPLMKPDDLQYFNKLLEDIDDDSLPPEEAKERKIMKLLLKIKNGTPPMRKSALRQITDKAREFGAGPLFNQILPLLMSPSLEDQEKSVRS